MENLSRLKGAESGNPKLSDKYKQAADELVEVARTQGYAKAISMLTGDNAQQQTQQVDPAESLAKMASVAQTMFGIEDAKSKSIREDAQTTAQLMMGLMERMMDNQKQGNSSDSTMSTILFQMMKDAQDRAERIAERAEERAREMQREHKEELEKAKASQNGKIDDPVENFKNQLLLSRLNYQPPSVRDQLEDATEVFKAFGINPMQQPQVGASERELALKEKEIDAQLKLAELEWKHKYETEMNKTDRWGSYIDKITGAIFAAASMMNPKFADMMQAGNTGANAAQATQQPQTGGYVRVACPNEECDLNETAVPRAQVDPRYMPGCPKCGTQLIVAGGQA